jgi:hypothetical protein
MYFLVLPAGPLSKELELKLFISPALSKSSSDNPNASLLLRVTV